ncbi:MAG: J domain-containing protein [Chloroflexi bacterium]|nr:J domain-containing protein [Chloroflexota bacterium]
MAPKDYYQILGVEKSATEKEIRQAYRNLAATLQSKANSTDNLSLEKIQDINKAFEVLSDPNDRKQYDALIEQSADESAPVASSQTLPTSLESTLSKSKRNRSVLTGILVNLLMLAFGVIIGFVGRPIVMPPPDPQSAALQKVIAATRHFRGEANAPVTIIEFADFQ